MNAEQYVEQQLAPIIAELNACGLVAEREPLTLGDFRNFTRGDTAKIKATDALADIVWTAQICEALQWLDELGDVVKAETVRSLWDCFGALLHIGHDDRGEPLYCGKRTASAWDIIAALKCAGVGEQLQ